LNYTRKVLLTQQFTEVQQSVSPSIEQDFSRGSLVQQFP